MPRKSKPWEQEGVLKPPGLPGALHAVFSDQDTLLPGMMPEQVTIAHPTDANPTGDSLAVNVPPEGSANVRHSDPTNPMKLVLTCARILT